jgi:hypothetical protein
VSGLIALSLLARQNRISSHLKKCNVIIPDIVTRRRVVSDFELFGTLVWV